MKNLRLILFTLMMGSVSLPAYALDLSALSQDVTISSLPVPVDDENAPAGANTNPLPQAAAPQPQITTAVTPPPSAAPPVTATTPPSAPPVTPPTPPLTAANAPPPPTITAAPVPAPGSPPTIEELYPPQNISDAAPQASAPAPVPIQNAPAPQTATSYSMNADTAAPPVPAAPVAEPASSGAMPTETNAAAAATPPTPVAPITAGNIAKNTSADALESLESFTRLGSGNKIKIQVFGEEDLSGEFEIDANGNLSLPLIGTVHASGLEPHDLEELITGKLKEGYLVNPLISLEVLNYKPIFILGEVNKPGSYPYTTGLTVINAVALGGGFTNRARKGRVTIFRASNGRKNEIDGTESTLVYPGDTIRIDERWF